MLQEVKDKILSKSLKTAINNQIKIYGKLEDFYLDSKKKRINLKILLAGENDSINVHIKTYELIQTNGLQQLKVSGVITSRRWINIVASAYLEGKLFDVPDEYVKIHKKIN